MQKSIKRNIPLLYLITGLKNVWFWLGCWVLYYSSFGGYSAVGLIETVMIVGSIVGEIPTGALADMLGKRRSIIVACFIGGIGQIWMGFAPDLANMIIAIIFIIAGGTLMSGCFEAMIFDSLAEIGEDEKYNRVLANVSSINMLVMAIASIAGGFLYRLEPGLPFVTAGAFQVIAGLVGYFLVEPKIEVEKFSLQSFLNQNKEGFAQLTRTVNSRMIFLSLSVISFINIIVWEGFNDILSVEVGFSAWELGIIISIILLISSISMKLISAELNKESEPRAILIGGFLYALTLILSVFVNKWIVLIMLMARNVVEPLMENGISGVLNRLTNSKYRATTLSTFSMVAQIPYALTVLAFTSMLDVVSAHTVALGLGLLLLTGVFFWGYVKKRYLN